MLTMNGNLLTALVTECWILQCPVVLKPYLCVGFHIVFLSAATVTAH